MITKRQVEILKAIDTYIKEKGYSPSMRDLADMTKIQSTSTIHKYIDTLEKLGCITKKESIPRALAITSEGMKLLKLLG